MLVYGGAEYRGGWRDANWVSVCRALHVLEREVRGCDERLWSIHNKLREKGVEEDEKIYIRRRY